MSQAFRAPGEPLPAIPPRFPRKPPAGQPPRRKPAASVPILPPEAAIGIPKIHRPNPNPMGHPPRIFRLVGGMFGPDMQNGDLLVAVPVSRYHCEGLYLISYGAPHIALYRCEARTENGQVGVAMWKGRDFDNTIWLPRAEFEEVVLAQVAITGRLVAAGLLPELVTEIVG